MGEMSPGGLAIELFKSTPFGKRALFCAKSSNVDEMFDKINWDLMDKRIDTTLGGPQVKQRYSRLLLSEVRGHVLAVMASSLSRPFAAQAARHDSFLGKRRCPICLPRPLMRCICFYYFSGRI